MPTKFAYSRIAGKRSFRGCSAEFSFVPAMKIAVLPGDGIGKEIVAETLKVLGRLGLKFEFEEAPVGGAGYEASGHPLPPKTLALAKQADAILFGSVGDPKYHNLESSNRPEQAILGPPKEPRPFPNLRPA